MATVTRQRWAETVGLLGSMALAQENSPWR
jgi:hypothetical protein